MKKTLTLLLTAILLSSCNRLVTVRQTVIYKNKSFYRIGPPQRVYLNEGDTIQLIIGNRKIKLKNGL